MESATVVEDPYEVVGEQSGLLVRTRYMAGLWSMVKNLCFIAAITVTALSFAGIGLTGVPAVLATVALCGAGLAAVYKQDQTAEKYRRLAVSIDAKNEAKHYAEELNRVVNTPEVEKVVPAPTPSQGMRTLEEIARNSASAKRLVTPPSTLIGGITPRKIEGEPWETSRAGNVEKEAPPHTV